MKKLLPFTKSQIEEIASMYPTPFHLYDECGIRENARRLNAAFAWCPGFKEYFAVKATPNPYILRLLKQEGCGADYSSLAELFLANKASLVGETIMFSSNDTPAEEFRMARELGAIINLDDISHINFLERHAGLPDLLSFRYNPGALRSGNRIIGNPAEAKFGLTRSQIFEAYRLAKEKNVKRFGLHTMVASNELNPEYIIATARMLFEIAVELTATLGIRMEFINIGGGIGIPYKLNEQAIDVEMLSDRIRNLYNATIAANGLAPLKIFMECGRFITGPYGYLVSTVLHIKDTYKRYVGLDASMADLMRPGMYGAYHHITVLGKEDQVPECVYDVTGSLCENNDKFAIDRTLPEIEVGDLVVLHDTGAHGHAMGFNYNGKLRSAELLLKADGSVSLIRRRETLEDYCATLDFSGL